MPHLRAKHKEGIARSLSFIPATIGLSTGVRDTILDPRRRGRWRLDWAFISRALRVFDKDA